MNACECGCGRITSIAKQSDTKLGIKKGDHRRFIHGHGNVAEPIENKYVVDPESGCWIWIRAQDGHGYGQYQDPRTGRGTHPHRYLYELKFGPLPRELHVDHLCRNRLCVNPDHCEAVTPRINLLRGVGASATNARKTHCVRGHEFTPENTKVSKYGRCCLACRRIRRSTPEFREQRNRARRLRYSRRGQSAQPQR